MENSEKTPLSDHLISPVNIKNESKVKVLTVKDGLLERSNSKVLTSSGKELLNEKNNRQII